MKFQRITEVIDGIVKVEDVPEAEVNEIEFLARFDRMSNEAIDCIDKMTVNAKINLGLIADTKKVRKYRGLQEALSGGFGQQNAAQNMFAGGLSSGLLGGIFR